MLDVVLYCILHNCTVLYIQCKIYRYTCGAHCLAAVTTQHIRFAVPAKHLSSSSTAIKTKEVKIKMYRYISKTSSVIQSRVDKEVIR